MNCSISTTNVTVDVVCEPDVGTSKTGFIRRLKIVGLRLPDITTGCPTSPCRATSGPTNRSGLFAETKSGRCNPGIENDAAIAADSVMIRVALSLLFFVAVVSHAAAPFVGEEFHKPFVNPTDDPKLPRVLLIGDSISIAYTTTVRRELKGRANVHRIKANGAFSARGLENIEKWIGDGRWDVIHFNFGLWDWYGWQQQERATPEFYADNLAKIVAALKRTGAKLIFATTTPPCDEPEHKIKVLVTEDQAKAFNAAAVKVMKTNGVAINDLYACISADRKKYSKGPADVHWNDAGSKLLGRQVAREIVRRLR